MDKAINAVLAEICNYQDLYSLVLERMNQISLAVAKAEAAAESEPVHFLLNSTSKLLKKESTFSSVLASVIALRLPSGAINRAMLDDMYLDERAKMTEHDFDKIVLDHYDCSDNRLCDNLRDDATLKCIILQFRVEMIAAFVLYLNSGVDADLLEELQSCSDSSVVLRKIAEVSSEYAQRFSSGVDAFVI